MPVVDRLQLRQRPLEGDDSATAESRYRQLPVVFALFRLRFTLLDQSPRVLQDFLQPPARKIKPLDLGVEAAG